MKRDVDIIRKEQIEKMAKDFCRVPCVCQKSRIDCDKTCEIYIFARRVYDAGYRKGETISYQAMIDHSYIDRINQLEHRLAEARKETAKEILCRLWGYNF